MLGARLRIILTQIICYCPVLMPFYATTQMNSTSSENKCQNSPESTQYTQVINNLKRDPEARSVVKAEKRPTDRLIWASL